MGAPYGKLGRSLEKTTLSQSTSMEGLPPSTVSIEPKAHLHGNLNSLDNSLHGLKFPSAKTVDDIKTIWIVSSLRICKKNLNEIKENKFLYSFIAVNLGLISSYFFIWSYWKNEINVNKWTENVLLLLYFATNKYDLYHLNLNNTIFGIGNRFLFLININRIRTIKYFTTIYRLFAALKT